MSSRCYIILGMHRSATSFLAKALYEQGVDMGKRLGDPDEYNPHGYYENQDIVHLNEKILSDAGGSWKDIPSATHLKRSFENNKEKILKVVEKSSNDLWGFKDPRTVWTFKGIVPYIKSDVYILPIFRSPLRIAKSLRKRDGIEIFKGKILAKRYNSKIYEIISNYPRYLSD